VFKRVQELSAYIFGEFMNNKSLSTIIINWNNKELTARCIESLQRSNVQGRLIIVDNGSQDGSGSYLCARYPEIDLIQLQSNHGFGAACNIAIQHVLKNTQDKFIFLLNNDALVQFKTLTKLLDEANRNPNAGILSPKILFRDNPARAYYSGANCRDGILAASKMNRGLHSQDSISVDYIFATAMLVRREVFGVIGGFDERFFLYLEDLDFCLRARSEGFELRYLPEARVWHYAAASTKKKREYRRFHKVRSTLLFLQKYAHLLSPGRAIPFWIIVAIRIAIQDLINRKPGLLVTSWDAFLESLKLAKFSRE